VWSDTLNSTTPSRALFKMAPRFTTLKQAHPYHPPDLVLEGFVPQQLPFEQTLAVFFTATFIVLAAGWRLSGARTLRAGCAAGAVGNGNNAQRHFVAAASDCLQQQRLVQHTEPPPLCTPWALLTAARTGNHKHLVTKERLLVCWFLCTGLIHFIVEGAVVLDSRFYKDTSKNILSEICECS